jgi:hypothetical protein
MEQVHILNEKAKMSLINNRENISFIYYMEKSKKIFIYQNTVARSCVVNCVPWAVYDMHTVHSTQHTVHSTYFTSAG